MGKHLHSVLSGNKTIYIGQILNKIRKKIHASGTAWIYFIMKKKHPELKKQ
jgi:predicted double-glycine peptidase